MPAPFIANSSPEIMPHFLNSGKDNVDRPTDTDWEKVQDTGQVDREKQQGQEPQMALIYQPTTNALRICVNPDFLATIPFADENDDDDEDVVDEDSQEVNSVNTIGRPFSSRSLSPSTASTHATGQATQQPVFTLEPVPVPAPPGQSTPPPPPSSQPQPVFTFKEPRKDSDDGDQVFVADGAQSWTMSPAAQAMFENMTRNAPTDRRRSSDPSRYLQGSDEENDSYSPGVLQMTHSLPLTSKKTYSCITEYKKAEKKEIAQLAEKLDISIDSTSQTSSKPTAKPQLKKEKMLKRFRKRFSKKTKKARKPKKHAGGLDALCSLGKHEDQADAIPFQRYSSAEVNEETLSNGFETDELNQSLRQAMRLQDKTESDREDEAGPPEPHDRLVPEPEEHSDKASGWTALKNSIREMINPRNFSSKQSFLLLHAPKKKGRIDYDKDKVARQKQYESFCEVYPGLNDSTYYKMEESVNTWEDMASCIKKFFKKGASHAVMSVIMFNGHGSENGLVLSKDDPVNLDKFIAKVGSLLEEHRQHHECQLPHLIKIIFAQCYGHKYEEPHRHDIQVISFTNPKLPKTQTTIKLDPLTRDVTDSTHHQLRSFASRSSIQEETNKLIRSRTCSLVASRSSIQEETNKLIRSRACSLVSSRFTVDSVTE